MTTSITFIEISKYTGRMNFIIVDATFVISQSQKPTYAHTIIILFLALFASSNAQFGKYFKNQTLRIDYSHSGSVEAEYIMPDGMTLEGKWAGSRKNLIDPFDFGADKIMVYDSVTESLIYTKGFSTFL
jgi:hypothetical protein